METNVVIFCYSNEGSTAKVAEGLAQATGGELRHLKAAGKPGPGAILASMLGISTRLIDANLELSGEDAVVLMTPVWAGSPAPASTSFIRQAKLQGKRVFFVTVGLAPTNPKAIAALEKRLAARGANVIGHCEVRGKTPLMSQTAANATPPERPDPTDDELRAAGVALATDLTAALARAGVVQ